MLPKKWGKNAQLQSIELQFQYFYICDLLLAQFYLPVPDASVPAVEICSLKSAAGMIFSANVTR